MHVYKFFFYLYHYFNEDFINKIERKYVIHVNIKMTL